MNWLNARTACFFQISEAFSYNPISRIRIGYMPFAMWLTVETICHIVQQRGHHLISYLEERQPRFVISIHLDVLPNFDCQSRSWQLFHLESEIEFTYSMKEVEFIESRQVMELSEPNMWTLSNMSLQVQFQTVISIPIIPTHPTPSLKSVLESAQLAHQKVVTAMMMMTSKRMMRRKIQAVTLAKAMKSLMSLTSNRITVIMTITRKLHRRTWHTLHRNWVNTTLHQIQMTQRTIVTNCTVLVYQDKT